MPGKSQRSRGKRLSRSKRRKSKQNLPAAVPQQQTVAQIDKPVSSPYTSVTPAKASTPAPTQTQYPYIATELRRIGILAGVMLAVLVVLALVFA